MKNWRHLLLSVTLATGSAWGTLTPSELFQKAGRAYDAGQFAEAATNYLALVAQGQRTPEVYFNLGNAEFRAGRGGAAVLAYRRAWHLAPRDADIIANLQFAQEQTGATPPTPASWEHFFQSLNAAEWRLAALVDFWILAGAACLALLWSARRALFRVVVIFLLVVLLLALGGVGYWFDLQIRQPEAVVIQPASALSAPLVNTIKLFALPAGSIVHIESRDGAWWHIQQGARAGWLPQSNCVAVCSAPN
ncbi:MAG: tetratricopeptide repeat protein [Verrucomicrobia bacterium]|nr:MAG: tetratricopeptide repeat protein [Verrucomicrobiota bacterium]